MEAQQSEAIRVKHNESLQRKAMYAQMTKQMSQHHEFSILYTDDSTDDEGKMNKKRSPPAWSKGRTKHLQIQANVALPVIDAFFSVQARTIDLKEIFPDIEPRRLKRNSSAVWRTPPRYSTLPKYWRSSEFFSPIYYYVVPTYYFITLRLFK